MLISLVGQNIKLFAKGFFNCQLSNRLDLDFNF